MAKKTSCEGCGKDIRIDVSPLGGREVLAGETDGFSRRLSLHLGQQRVEMDLCTSCYEGAMICLADRFAPMGKVINLWRIDNAADIKSAHKALEET